MQRKRGPIERVTVTLQRDEVAALRRFAESDDRSLSHTVAQAVRMFLAARSSLFLPPAHDSVMRDAERNTTEVA